jgi:hypothetical protein
MGIGLRKKLLEPGADQYDLGTRRQHETMKSILLGVLAAGLLGPARADEPAIIARARAYLGSESALEAVRSIHLSGTVVGDNVTDASAKPWVAKVEIIFQKPWRESLIIRYPHQIVRTALDGFEAWQQVQDNVADGQTVIDSHRASSLVVFRSLQVKNLRADTWYNLNFYRGIEATGGTIADEGEARIDGVDCEKIAFLHSPVLVYTRYFDRATGRLVYTQTPGGARIRESGEIIAGGIRFPKTIVSSETAAKGRVVSSTYNFESVVLNEVFPADLFSVPLLPVTDDAGRGVSTVFQP